MTSALLEILCHNKAFTIIHLIYYCYQFLFVSAGHQEDSVEDDIDSNDDGEDDIHQNLPPAPPPKVSPPKGEKMFLC